MLIRDYATRFRTHTIKPYASMRTKDAQLIFQEEIQEIHQMNDKSSNTGIDPGSNASTNLPRNNSYEPKTSLINLNESTLSVTDPEGAE